MRRVLVTLVAAISTLGLVAVAAAQDPAPRPRVIELPKIDIFGARQQPGGQYILTRSGNHYEVRELRTSFVPNVVRSVETEPF